MSLKNILRKHLITESNHHLNDEELGFIKKISEYLINECGDYLNSCEIYLSDKERTEYKKLSNSDWVEKAEFIVKHLPKQTSQKYSFCVAGYDFDIYFSNALYEKGVHGQWDITDNAVLLSPVPIMMGEDVCVSVLSHEITHIPQKRKYREDVGGRKDFIQEINKLTYWFNWNEVDARISQAYAYVRTQIFTGERRDDGDVVETDYSETEKLVKQGGSPSHHGWNGMGNIQQKRYNNVVNDQYFHDGKQTVVKKIRDSLRWYMGYGVCGELAKGLHERLKKLEQDMAAVPGWRQRFRTPTIVHNFTDTAEFLSTFLIAPNDILMDDKMSRKFYKYYVNEDCLDQEYRELIDYILYIMLEIGKRLKKMERVSGKMAYELYTQMLRDKEYAATHGEKPIKQTPNYDTWNKLSDYHQRKEKEYFSKLS